MNKKTKSSLILLISGFGVFALSLIMVLLVLFNMNILTVFELQIQVLIAIIGATYFFLEFVKELKMLGK